MWPFTFSVITIAVWSLMCILYTSGNFDNKLLDGKWTIYVVNGPLRALSQYDAFKDVYCFNAEEKMKHGLSHFLSFH